jgi:hypothetical protein
MITFPCPFLSFLTRLFQDLIPLLFSCFFIFPGSGPLITRHGSLFYLLKSLDICPYNLIWLAI